MARGPLLNSMNPWAKDKEQYQSHWSNGVLMDPGQLLGFSSAFQDCPQTSRLVVLMNLACLQQVLFVVPELFCKHGSLGTSVVSVLLCNCIGSRTPEHALGSVALSHQMDRWLCVTDQRQSGTGGQAGRQQWLHKMVVSSVPSLG